MGLTIIGLGLNDESDITLRGLEAVKNADHVYLDIYTSILQTTIENLEKAYGKKIIPATREIVEQKAETTILLNAKNGKTAFLVVGDPLGATTHTDLITRAKDMGITVSIIHNTSIISAAADCGLSIYKFGKTTSIPFFAIEQNIETPIRIIEENQSINAHTLILLDLDPPNKKYMTVEAGLKTLIAIADRIESSKFGRETLVIGCARIGTPNPTIKAGSAQRLILEEFGDAPHCIIVPAKMHFTEEEAIEKIRVS